jgi:hypothetical protein
MLTAYDVQSRFWMLSEGLRVLKMAPSDRNEQEILDALIALQVKDKTAGKGR